MSKPHELERPSLDSIAHIFKVHSNARNFTEAVNVLQPYSDRKFIFRGRVGSIKISGGHSGYLLFTAFEHDGEYGKEYGAFPILIDRNSKSAALSIAGCETVEIVVGIELYSKRKQISPFILCDHLSTVSKHNLDIREDESASIVDVSSLPSLPPDAKSIVPGTYLLEGDLESTQMYSDASSIAFVSMPYSSIDAEKCVNISHRQYQVLTAPDTFISVKLVVDVNTEKRITLRDILSTNIKLYRPFYRCPDPECSFGVHRDKITPPKACPVCGRPLIVHYYHPIGDNKNLKITNKVSRSVNKISLD